MSRTVDGWEGLALRGSGGVGPVRWTTPALLASRAPAEEGPGPSLRHEGGSAGVRRYRLSDGERSVTLEIPVLAPEVQVGDARAHRVAERAWYVHAPLAPGDVERVRADRPELLVLGNAAALWHDGRPFVEALARLRADLGVGPLLWAPRVALPHRLPLLAYLGVDLLDTVAGRFAATRGTYVDATFGSVEATAFRAERACDCPGCATEPPDGRARHADAQYDRALREVRAALRAGRLRELVEARQTSEPLLAELLRYADRDLAGRLEAAAPVTGGPNRAFVLAESFRRPEMARFRARVIERYRPPASKSVLLLVPCSRTKPYRHSPSHRRFGAALDGLRGLERIHVVSLSSPIGVVPRELEDVSPAREYDIPVTGDWSEPERAAIEAGLRHLAATGSYRATVVHLDPGEYDFLGRTPGGLPAPVWTAHDGRPTSPASLGALRAAAAASLGDGPAPGTGPLAVVREELRELAAFQFGRTAADRLFAPPVRLAGRPWFQRLTDGRADLATVREERGLFHLTVAGARRLFPEPPLAVEIDPTLPLTGDLFAPGVRSADPAIRAGDSVVLLRAGRLAGVGEAAVPGPWMTELGHGLAVKVRHRAGPPTDTPKSDEVPDRPGPVV